jgi:hypothetical protein
MVRRSVEVEVLTIVQTFVQHSSVLQSFLSDLGGRMTELHSICTTIFMITYEIQ